MLRCYLNNRQLIDETNIQNLVTDINQTKIQLIKQTSQQNVDQKIQFKIKQNIIPPIKVIEWENLEILNQQNPLNDEELQQLQGIMEDIETDKTKFSSEKSYINL